MDINYRSATELAALIEKLKVYSRDLLEHFLERTDRFNGKLNAIIARCDAAAGKRADEADKANARGESWGPLHEIRMRFKIGEES